MKDLAINRLSVVDAVKKSTHKKNRVSMLCGAVLGGFVPSATYVIGHHDAQAQPMLWLFVAGGLAYSAISVYEFAKQAFKKPAKALGFVLLIEGAMTFSLTPGLCYAALALLIAINAISAGCNLALDAKENKR